MNDVSQLIVLLCDVQPLTSPPVPVMPQGGSAVGAGSAAEGQDEPAPELHVGPHQHPRQPQGRGGGAGDTHHISFGFDQINA